MDACERQQYIREQRERIMAEATRATLDRLRDLRPRAVPIDIPAGLDRWRADAQEQQRKRRAETRRRRQQKADDMNDMARATQAGDDYWTAIDQRIEAAVARAVEAAIKRERRRNHKLMASVLGELQAIIYKRLDAAIAAADDVSSKLMALSKDGVGPDGVHRKVIYTPH